MIVLALETATRAGSVALLDGSVCRAARGDASRTHGERLPGELVDAAAAAGRAIRDVDLFAVVLGPGSFTGLRVGVAAIQGLALVAGKGVVGISTLDALARGSSAQLGEFVRDRCRHLPGALEQLGVVEVGCAREALPAAAIDLVDLVLRADLHRELEFLGL